MESERPSVVFFDIGDTLVPARLGIISNRGAIPEANVNQALENAGLFVFFTPNLIFYGPKDSTAISFAP
jgi:hypothetical protein